jgi:hypothetical protein
MVQRAVTRYWRVAVGLALFVTAVLIAGGNFQARPDSGDRPTQVEYPGVEP